MNESLYFVNIGIAAFSTLICLVKLVGRGGVEKEKNRDAYFYFCMVRNNALMLGGVFFANISPYIFAEPEIYNFVTRCFYAICYVTYYLTLTAFVFYAYDYISAELGRTMRPAGYTVPVVVIYTIIWVISAFNGMVFYHDDMEFIRGPFYLPGQIGNILILAQPFVMMLRNRKSISRQLAIALSSFMIMPLMGLFFKHFVPEIDFVPYAIMLSTELMGNVLHFKRDESIREQQNELSQMRLQLLLSQIKPHFLYNVLNSIYVLCDKDPQMAQEAIGNFSEFLRANIDNIGQEKWVAFSKEMELVEYYLSLQRIRFGDKIRVVKDIGIMGFKVPSLSVQILVENAVKHGILKKDGGGTLTISTYEENDCAVVEVKDDGAGMTKTQESDSDGLHVGLENLRQRLETSDRGATLEIISKEGEGTRAMIRIPIKDRKGSGRQA